jgi:hypothetical protein
LLMRFDGKIVFVGPELPPRAPLDKGEVFGIRIVGPAVVDLLENQMRWEEYQEWIDGLRGKGFTLTTHRTESGERRPPAKPPRREEE